MDRRLGTAVRRATHALPAGPGAARAVAGAMSPAFRIVVAAMVARAPTRGAGMEALAAGAGRAWSRGRCATASAARGPAPGRRAASPAATRPPRGHRARRRQGRPRVRRALAVAAAAGLLARVAAAEHEPADIAAGALVGVVAALAVERLVGERLG